MLYEKGKIKSEIKKLIHEKNIEQKNQNELNLCTFKPKLNKYSKTDNFIRHYSNKEDENEATSTVYDRSIYLKNKKDEKYYFILKFKNPK